MIKKCQVGLEYLILVGFILLAILPIVYYVYSNAYLTKDQILISQVQEIANEIASTSDTVYSYGYGSKISLRFTFPEDICNISISGKQIVFYVYTSSGLVPIYSYAYANLSGNISNIPGIHEIHFLNKGDYVEIYE